MVSALLSSAKISHMMNDANTSLQSLHKIHIMFVDEAINQEEECFRYLKTSSAGVIVADTYRDAIDIFSKNFVNISIVNAAIRDGEGVSLVERLREMDEEAQIIVISDGGDLAFLKRALNLGVNGYMDKPLQLPGLKNVLQRCIDHVINPVSGFYNKNKLSDFLKLKDHGTLMLAELDNLDHYNSAYGLAFGETLIGETARFLDRFKPDGSKIWQISAGVFAIGSETLDLHMAEEFATMLNVLVSENRIEVNRVEINVTFTIGIASGDMDELLGMADFALRDAKKVGHRSYQVYQGNSTIETIQKENLMWMNRVKNALERSSISPWFQPILNNHTRKIEKFECLARLEDMPDEAVAPHKFLEPARLVGLLPNISYAIINKSFAKFAGNTHEFSINISFDDLKSDSFVNFIINRCEHYDVDPSRVIVEVLESVGMNGNFQMSDKIKELKRCGFQLAVDDFGTMNSNFSRLYEMEADYLKIDGAFIKNLDTDKRSYNIAKSIARFAKSIGAKTVAEYVHSSLVQDICMEIGIDYSQGYHIGVPSPEIKEIYER